MKAVFVFCEGEHDIAFVSRTLIATDDFERDDTTIAQFPEFLKKILTKRFQEQAVEKVLEKVGAQKYSKMPPPVLWYALKPKKVEDQVLLLFFCAFGQDQHNAIGKFIRGVQLDLKFRREKHEDPGISSEAFAFLYDADEDGEQVKLEKWHQNYSTQFPGIAIPSESAWQRPKDSENLEVGIYILRGAEQVTGELEDIVLPLMKRHDEPLYEEAAAFVEKHWVPESATKKKRKATITVAGQIHHPSYSMAVILRDTQHLKNNALNADPSCQRIVQFFKQVCAIV
jgi:hypothetical protein